MFSTWISCSPVITLDFMFSTYNSHSLLEFLSLSLDFLSNQSCSALTLYFLSQHGFCSFLALTVTTVNVQVPVRISLLYYPRSRFFDFTLDSLSSSYILWPHLGFSALTLDSLSSSLILGSFWSIAPAIVQLTKWDLKKSFYEHH
jgi:hypothetical protein